MINYDFKNIQDYIVGIRRDIHRAPEVGTNLPKTQEYIMKELDKLGIEYKKGTLDSSIIGIIKGAKDGKTIALRTDMDALAVEEETSLPFASTNGNMHACGHDGHIAIVLGAAKVLSENKDKFNGNVKLLFQTSEETAQGAKILIKEGALDCPKVDALIGCHVGTIATGVKNGTFVIQGGPLMASYDKFILKIRGKGSHGASPHRGIDPIVIAGNIITAIQNISSREILASDPVVVSLCSIHGGRTYNVIPDEVVIEGTTRALKKETRHTLMERIESIAQCVAESLRGEVELEVIWGALPVINDAEFSVYMKGLAEKTFGHDAVYQEQFVPSMIGEDVSMYLDEVIGSFFLFTTIVVNNFPHHNSKFDIDESKLYMPAGLMVVTAIDFLT